jgi:hypothetical protein
MRLVNVACLLEIWFILDLANGSGQSGSGLTHAGSGQKTGHPKWVA